MVRPRDRQVAQQIGTDLVPRLRLRRSRLRSQRGDPHLAHQPLHPLAVDRKAFLLEHYRHPPRAEKRPEGEQLVEPTHHQQIVVVDRCCRPVDPRAGKAQKPALSTDREPAVLAIDERASVRCAHLPDLLAKKSRSTVNCPILACSFSISRSRAASPSLPTPVSKARAACSSNCFFQA